MERSAIAIEKVGNSVEKAVSGRLENLLGTKRKKELENLYADSEKENKELRSIVDRLKSDIREQEKRLVELQEIESVRDAEIRGLKGMLLGDIQEVDDMKKEREVFLSDLERTAYEKDKFHKGLQQLSHESTSLQSGYQDLQKQLAMERSSRERERQTLMEQNECVREQIELLTKEILKREEAKSSVIAQLEDDKANEIGRMSADLNKQMKTNQELTAQIQGQSVLLDNAKKAVDQLASCAQATSSRQSKALSDIESRLVKKTALLSGLQSHIDHAVVANKSHIAMLTQTIAEGESRLKEVTDRDIMIQNDMRTEIQKLTEDVESHRQLQQAGKRLRMQGEVNSLVEELVNSVDLIMKDRLIAKATEEAHQLKKDLSDRDHEINRLNTLLQDLNVTLDQFKQEMVTLKNSREVEHAILRKAERDLQDAALKRQQAERNAEASSVLILEKERDIETLKKRQNDSQKQVEHAEREISNLKTTNLELRSLLSKMETAVRAQEDMAAQLENEAELRKQSEEMLTEVSEELKLEKAQSQNHANEAKSLAALIDKLQREYAKDRIVFDEERLRASILVENSPKQKHEMFIEELAKERLKRHKLNAELEFERKKLRDITQQVELKQRAEKRESEIAHQLKSTTKNITDPVTSEDLRSLVMIEREARLLAERRIEEYFVVCEKQKQQLEEMRRNYVKLPKLWGSKPKDVPKETPDANSAFQKPRRSQTYEHHDTS